MTAACTSDLVAQIDAILPQTQCTKCGYDGCLPYAQALADGVADINRCPPGDIQGMQALAQLLGREPKAIDPSCGTPGPLRVAVIDPEHCIGCTLCIKACPVDAIVGTNKRMHTVLPDWCTGCDLCIAPCPVDCISMQVIDPKLDPTVDPKLAVWDTTRANLARQRYQSTQARRHQKAATQAQITPPAPVADKASLIAAALAKARARRTGAA